jgi:hypothetical protein
VNNSTNRSLQKKKARTTALRSVRTIDAIGACRRLLRRWVFPAFAVP